MLRNRALLPLNGYSPIQLLPAFSVIRKGLSHVLDPLAVIPSPPSAAPSSADFPNRRARNLSLSEWAARIQTHQRVAAEELEPITGVDGPFLP
jgi:hypothetical protein